MRFGVNMYGVNSIFRQDPEAFFQRIARAGYRYVEPCLIVDEIPGLEAHRWTMEELDSYQELMKKYGIQIDSCHAFITDLDKAADRLVGIAQKYGIRQFIVPCPSPMTKENCEKAVPVLRKTAEALHAVGAEALIHNSKEQSVTWIDGMTAYEWLLHACGDCIGAQPDLGWLIYGGEDPESFLWRNEKQVRSLHYKDMEQTEDGLKETGVGTGLTDMTACFQFARAIEVIQYIDQDGSKGDFIEDIERVGGLFQGLEQARDRSKSILCTMDVETGEITKLHTFEGVIEAPNWMQTDEDVLFYNAGGHIFRYQISADTSVMLESGMCDNCNNDHVLSPDNTEIAVSHSIRPSWYSKIYIFPIEGGEPRLVTPKEPSFLHGWSPDGKELAYCAFRDHGKGFEIDIHTISVEGGEETQLTANAGFNDGPEYSPDGKHIWFISTRSGLMQCWRMNRDGSEQTQMTFHARNNWFPHVSPDGSKVVYLSYSRDGLDPNEHLPNMPVQLRLMNYDGSDDHCILEFFGGQGSINVNSWHRDSKKIAFVMYELEHK